MWKTIFVMTGHPCQKPPAPVMLVEMQVKAGTERIAAKKYRKEQATMPGNYGLAELAEKGFRLKPSDLYYAVFEKLDDPHPIMASDNYYWRQQMK